MKQSFASALGTPLNQPKTIHKLGLILSRTRTRRASRSGSDFQHLDDLPQSDLPVLSEQLHAGFERDLERLRPADGGIQ